MPLVPAVIRPGYEVQNAVSGAKYILGETLGAGGFGVAFKASRLAADGGRETETCLKFTKDSDSWHGEAFFGRLLNSAPHAIRTLDSFPVIVTTGKQRKRHSVVFCIETEYIEAGTVEGACANGRLPWPEDRVRRQLRLLLRTLNILHLRGIAHRDITPSNVFVANHGVLKLGDFGIARMQLQRRGNVVDFVTLVYAPPDLEGFWNPADDTYQVGLLALTLLCGKPVTNEDDLTTLIDARSSGRLRSVLKKATNSVKARRFRDAGLMYDALSR